MNKIVIGLGFPLIAIISAIVPTAASATIASGNAGSIVKISNTCTDMANVANNNKGSIVEISGGGQCDINDILKGSAVTNNAGSIVKISNVCGTATSAMANDNKGSIVKIESTGPCKKDSPTTVVVTNEKTAVKTEPIVTELPKTGLGANTAIMASLISGGAYLTMLFAGNLRSNRFVS